MESHFKNVHAQQFRQNMSQEALIPAQPAECGRAALKAVNCVFTKPWYRSAIDGKDFPTRKTGYPDMADTRAHVRIAPPPLRLIFMQSHAPPAWNFSSRTAYRVVLDICRTAPARYRKTLNVTVHPCNTQALARAMTGQAEK
ncbi:hypothetical protein [Cupriavidus plantarum]|uniref:hypothetical protein n=1 Tax=Cupriavidus plantarum TaxID=942865 RepID=UPI0015CD0ACE|nr:hypothetical protein [Cupriavidus plantarum]NYI01767.1 hypothetical protein [Cupriavidus plantarum]